MAKMNVKLRNELVKIIDEHFNVVESDKTVSISDIRSGCDLGVFAELDSRKAANKILELFDVKRKEIKPAPPKMERPGIHLSRY